MGWDVEYTDEFGQWWETLAESQQEDVAAVTELLIGEGPKLRFPYSSGIERSRHDHMRELRVQSQGHPIRVLRSCTSSNEPSLVVYNNGSPELLCLPHKKTGAKAYFLRKKCGCPKYLKPWKTTPNG